MDKTKRMHRGLWARLANGGLNELIAMEIANACYPNAKKDRVPTKPPIVSQQLVWKYTEDYLDNGTITLDTLYQKVWGESVKDFYAFIGS